MTTKKKAVKAPAQLWMCKSFDEQKAWVRGKLEEGFTVSDPGLFLGGADPDTVIRALRREGMKIQTVRKPTTDAAGTVHQSLAWKLAVAESTTLPADAPQP